MAVFHFRLEQVLAYRRQLEEEAMQALAEATMRRDATLARIERLGTERDEQRERLSKAQDLAPAELWLARSYDEALREDLARQQELLAAQEEEVHARRIALVEKAQERELLDKLKEKQAKRHAEQERQKEQREFDETATLRYKPAAV